MGHYILKVSFLICFQYLYIDEHVKSNAKGTYDQCCNFGKKIIENPFEDFPEKLRTLFERNSHRATVDPDFDLWAKNFKENIRYVLFLLKTL